MKNNPNHGNRLRPPDKAYQVKKQRAKETYARMQLERNPFWQHNRILRDLYNLYGTGVEIPLQEFDKRGFDASQYKSTSTNAGTTYLYYDKYAITITSNKKIIIWKT